MDRSSATRAWSGAGRLLATLVLPTAFALTAASTSAAETEPNCSTAPNPIVCENALPGDPPSDWQITGVGDSSIQGFATSMSVNVGQTESFKIKTPASSYHINILRLGYYGGSGARLVASNIQPTAQLPQAQPECLHEAATGLIDCGNWGVSAQWTVPTTAVSGVYIAELVRDDTGGKSQIIFVVRNDESHSKILLQTSDATWEAYNDYGGNSLYSCTVECPSGKPKAYKAAYSVSYNRPFDGAFATDNGASYLWYAEYQMMRFLERNGYDVSYTTGGQVDQNGALLKNHKVFMSSGHDEYWSGPQRANVEAAREAGVNLAFFSANEIFWKTRWGASIDGSATPYRTLTTYKETHFEGPVDPKDPPTWTGAWRDPRGGPQSDGGHPENALSGQQFEVNSGTAEMTVPAQYGKLRLWRNTAVAGLQSGQTLTIGANIGTLGYEWDEDVDNGFRPAGEFDLSSTTVSGLQAFVDYGSSLTNNATRTHHLTLYRASSGALVFGAGTVQWSWGLDNTNAWNNGATDPEHPPVDPNMQQFTVNLLAEMGAAPETLASGLAQPVPSSDTSPPTSTITAPAPGEPVQDGSQTTITGTATDSGGGVVAGVEVSTDNGTTWHPATLTSPAETSVTWSYAWTAHGYPATTIRSRAVDDSANLETPSAGVHVNIACPCSIWGTSVTPPTPDSADPHSVSVGVKFTTETFGVISGIRFYKSSANTGTHIGDLWSSSGQRLATATFSGETESGWQQVNFSTPVDVFPGNTYVASYFDPTGHYAASAYYFYTPPATGGNVLNSPPLHALPAGGPPAGGAFASANGVFTYSNVDTFPTSSFAGTNYWVDPVFTPVSAAGEVTGVSATASNSSATVSWRAPSTGGPVTSYTITPYIGSTA
ncbi:MAG TPA: N,N-dimethylformamidase beta subunit family domain-containing protein, partial [Solirubrobacteraceae bacterium]|nr:N,N-dimethylformamidase beta subunit family domain-containing protein [Solirubrobacteraceae bacterium]